MLAFGYSSIMLCFGILLRAKIPFLRSMLVPASVIAGILGFFFMNCVSGMGISVGTDTSMFSAIVNHLFTVSFISISLTRTPKENGKTIGNVLHGALGLGLVWCLLYALTPLTGAGIIYFWGKNVNMNPLYGMLIPFAFCQGPGQSAAYGAIFEQYGWSNASTVAIALSAIGFIMAFLVGIPAAKLGIKKGIAKNCSKIDDAILKGYYTKEEQTKFMVKDTTHNGNIETLAFHFALIGVCYILAVGISKVLGKLPGFLGSSMSSMMFMNGMYAAYIVKFIMDKLHLDFLQENVLQSKITGFTADYLVVCAFMSVSVSVIQHWLIPILVLAIVSTILTVITCFYFGQRFGGENDFERLLGLYGTCTGTVPSGIALIRMVDSDFRTTTAIELGACNLTMLASTPVYLFILALASGSLEMGVTLGGLAICVIGYLAALKLTKTWGEKTFSWK
ncbi:MAG: sodium:glutamate symporter [Lachnospiraceae bacterium]|nr:sodium:glutamate symporter [Lachnospiraceae bacterium]